MTPENKETKPPITVGDYREIIPKCLLDLGIEMKYIELGVVHDAPTYQTSFTYTVIWDDDTGSEQKYVDVLNKHSTKYFGVPAILGGYSDEEKTERSDESKIPEIPEKPEEPTVTDAKTQETSAADASVKDSTKDSESSTASVTASNATSSISTDLKTSGEPSATSKSASEASSMTSSSVTSASSASSQSKSRKSKKSPRLTPSPRRKCTKPARLSTHSKTTLSLKSLPRDASSSDSASTGVPSEAPPDVIVAPLPVPPKARHEKLEKVLAKLIIIENMQFRGKLGAKSSLYTTGSTRVLPVLKELLRDYKPENGMSAEQLIDSGSLYVCYRSSGQSKLRRILPEGVGIVKFEKLPKIDSSVYLVLDLVQCISKNKQIQIQLDSDEHSSSDSEGF